MNQNVALLFLAVVGNVAAGPGPDSPAVARGKALDGNIGTIYLYALLGVVGLVFVYTSANRGNVYIRRLVSITDNKGPLRYYSTTSTCRRWIKANILYAPLLNYRRAREIRFSKRITLGALPTRLQSTFLFLVILGNIFTSTWNIPWSGPRGDALSVLMNRTGTLAVINMIPVTLLATAKNPLISMLDISYDTFNLMHRCFGRLSALQAIAHGVCWFVDKVETQGWAGVRKSTTSPFIYNGLIAGVGMAIILLHSPKLFRALAYEFFLHTHFALVVAVMVFLWVHLNRRWQQRMLLNAICIWAFVRAGRLFTLLRRSVGRGGSMATIEPLEGGAVKISIKTARPWSYRPGQSLYLTIPSVGLWTAHPFSVAWSGVEQTLDRSTSFRSTDSEKQPGNRGQDIQPEIRGVQTISLVVKAHTGLTRKLLNRAAKPNATLTLRALVEGPYGNQRSLSSYGTVMLFASGVGITHQIGYVKQLVGDYHDGTIAAKRVTLVWVIPSTDCVDWIRPWMHEILGIDGRREVLRVHVYVTRAGLSQSLTSPSATVRMSRGRPNVEEMMRCEMAAKAGCMGISVCAGGGLADEVRRASRVMLSEGANLDFMEEGFGW